MGNMSQLLEIFDHLEYEDIRNVKKLNEYFDKIDDLEPLSEIQKNYNELQTKIEDLRVDLGTLSGHLGPIETNQREVEDKKKVVDQQEAKIKNGEKDKMEVHLISI